MTADFLTGRLKEIILSCTTAHNCFSVLENYSREITPKKKLAVH